METAGRSFPARAHSALALCERNQVESGPEPADRLDEGLGRRSPVVGLIVGDPMKDKDRNRGSPGSRHSPIAPRAVRTDPLAIER